MCLTLILSVCALEVQISTSNVCRMLTCDVAFHIMYMSVRVRLKVITERVFSFSRLQ